MNRVLFVCTGNICRSPTAEGIFRHLVNERGLDHAFEVDSAGIIAYHEGEKPDPRSRQMSQSRGISLEGQRARQVIQSDFSTFDHILAMDKGHFRELCSMGDSSSHAQVSMFLAALDGDQARDVPDPYYGGERGFIEVYDLIYEGCEALLDQLDTR